LKNTLYILAFVIKAESLHTSHAGKWMVWKKHWACMLHRSLCQYCSRMTTEASWVKDLLHEDILVRYGALLETSRSA